jgi:hypothetical protein
VTFIFPQRAVDEADSERILLQIAVRSLSFRIEPIFVSPLRSFLECGDSSPLLR